MTTTNIHGCALVLGCNGLLLRGPSGSGKSSLAHALVGEWLSAGQFASWVADDRVDLAAVNDRLIATAPKSLAGLAETRGAGVMPVPHVPNCLIDLIVDLTESSRLERMPEPHFARVELQNGKDISVKGLLVPHNDVRVSISLVKIRLPGN